MVTLQHIRRWRWGLTLLTALGVMLLMQPLTARAETVRADTITVTNTLDDGDGSLRAAITAAIPGDTIIFDDSLSGLAITLATQLDIAKNLTIDGSGLATPLTLSGNNATRLFYVQATGNVTLNHLRIVSGTVTGNGGGIYNAGTVNVTHCTLAGNAATAGGGLYNAGGTATVEASTLISNTATSHGGGLYTTGGTATVRASTLTNNRTTHTPWVNGYGGGGLYNSGSTLNVQNSTLANNASPHNSGGGLYNAGRATVRASTLSGNSADYGGGIWNESGYLELQQTIVANSSSGHDCHRGMDSGDVTSLDGLFEATGADACGVFGDYNTVFGVDPLLGPLADNGGPTPTFALLPNSPAIDAVKLGSCLPTDQRGASRTADLRCDIGAYELQHADSDTVVKSGLTTGDPYTFGPTRLRLTVTGGNAGTITATKHLTTPGGVYNTGEITATWWLTASGESFTATVAFCYTLDDIAGLSEADLQAFRWDGSAWEEHGGVVAGGCVIVENVTAFSAWTLFDTSKGATPTAARVVGMAARGIVPFLAGLPLAGLLVLGGAATLFRRRRRL